MSREGRMNMHERAQRIWRAAQPDHGRSWVGVTDESVAMLREAQLRRLRYILVDMGPSGLNELNDDAITLVRHCIRARERQGWCPAGMYAERVDRELRSKQR